MKIERLNLANFRGFKQIELEFEPDVNVIAGVNGVGKSAILQALAVLFSRVLPEFTPSTARSIPFTDEDIHHDKPSLESSAIFTVAGQRCHMGVQRIRDDGDGGDLWNRFWQAARKPEAESRSVTFQELLADRTLTGDLEAGKAQTERVLEELRDRRQQPVVIYFSTRRHLPGRPRTLPEQRAFEIANAYGFALQDREVEVRDVMHWFRVVESGVSRAHKQSAHVLDDLRRVVTAFMPEFTNLRIEEQPVLRFVVEKAGMPLALNQLSDGERGLLAAIFDLTRRLAIANPELDDPVAEGNAIVLIDEIELHLHPKWQRQVLRRFTETFKNCQFIVTTHSPQVVGEVESRCLRFLLCEDEDIVPWTPPRSLGLDSSRVLEELMDVKARNAKVEDTLGEVFRLIDVEDFKAANQRIEALEKILGENDPELTRARALMAFLEGAG